MTDQTDDPYEVLTTSHPFLYIDFCKLFLSRVILGVKIVFFSLTCCDVLLQDEDDEEGEFEMYRVQGTLREWVTRDEVRHFIAKKFREFLLTYVNAKNDRGEPEYVQLINEMVSGKSSHPT